MSRCAIDSLDKQSGWKLSLSLVEKSKLLIPGTGNGERGTGNGSLGTNVQRQPA